MTLESRIYDGQRAKEILDNEVFKQVFIDCKNEITDQWKNSPARDEQGREKLWLMLSLANKLESMIKTTLETGRLSLLELDHRKSVAERAKEWIGQL